MTRFRDLPFNYKMDNCPVKEDTPGITGSVGRPEQVSVRPTGLFRKCYQQQEMPGVIYPDQGT